MLAEVDWNERQLTITGFSLMLGFGTLFIEPEVLKQFPLVVGLLLRQPIIVGVASLLILTAILPGRRSQQPVEASPSVPALEPAPAANPTLHSIGGTR
jgi:xanthine/uracil permease